MSRSSPEHADFSAERSEKVFRSPAARLLRDFSLSFYFAQGEPAHYRATSNGGLDFVLCFAGYEYERTLPLEDPLFDNLPDTLEQVESSALRLGPPREHETFTEEERQLQVTDSWSVFKSILLGDATPYDHFGYADFVKQMTTLMLVRDQHYILTGRPGRTEGGDPYLSHFREYVLHGEGRNLGSPIFEGIFAAIRSHYPALLAEDRIIRVMSHSLEAKWEKRHPGELFGLTTASI